MYLTIDAVYQKNNEGGETSGDVHISHTQDGIVFIMPELNAQVTFQESTELFKSLRNIILESEGLL